MSSTDRLRQFTHDAIVRAEGADFDDGAVPAVLSTDAIARDGARILQDGWELENFRRNPVVLFNHDDGGGGMLGSPSRTLPLGAWRDVEVTGGKLRGVADFDMADPFAVEVLGKIERRLINATSVRWLPLEHRVQKERLEDGGAEKSVVVFARAELIEASIVVLPTDPGAEILRADGHGIALDDYLHLDDDDPPTLYHGLTLTEAFEATELYLRDRDGSVFTDAEGDAAGRLHATLRILLGGADRLADDDGEQLAAVLDQLTGVMRGVLRSVQRTRGPDATRVVAEALATVTGRSAESIYRDLKGD